MPPENMNVSAIIVTRGDVDLGPVLHSLRSHFDDVVVWDNSVRENLRVYGRYAALKEAKHDLIYTQDDDCVTDPAAIVGAFTSGEVVLNMPAAKRDEYKALAPNAGLVGWGACFERPAADVLHRYIERYAIDELFLRECDRVFTQLNSLQFLDVPFRNLPWAHSSNRMGSERQHLADLAEITRRVKSLIAAPIASPATNTNP